MGSRPGCPAEEPAVRHTICHSHSPPIIASAAAIIDSGLEVFSFAHVTLDRGVDPVNLDVLRGEPLAARLSIDLQMIGIFTHFAGLASLAIAPDSSHHLLRLLLMEDI